MNAWLGNWFGRGLQQWPGATRAVATFGTVVTWATCKVVVGIEPTGLFACFLVFCFTYRALCQYQGTAAYLGTPRCVSAFHAALLQIEFFFQKGGLCAEVAGDILGCVVRNAASSLRSHRRIGTPFKFVKVALVKAVQG